MEQLRVAYNTERAYSSLSYPAPVQFAQAHVSKDLYRALPFRSERMNNFVGATA
jgi:hypothetical protein